MTGMDRPKFDVVKLLDGKAVAAGGNVRASLGVRGARSFAILIYATLGGGTAAYTFESHNGFAGATAVSAAAFLHLHGIVEARAPVDANIGTTGTTAAYNGLQATSAAPGGAAAPITGHHFDAIITITGGTGAVVYAIGLLGY